MRIGRSHGALVATLAITVALTAPADARVLRDARAAGETADATSRAFDAAQFRGDGPALERMLAPDFLYVRGSGRVASAKEFIATLPTLRNI